MIINIKKTKEFALACSKERRNGKFTRISKDALERWEARLKNIISDDVYRHPSIGKTIK